MRGRPRVVGNYRIKQNSRHNNFLIHPEYIYQESLTFVYTGSSGNTVNKTIPLRDLAPHLKVRKFYSYDDEGRYAHFRGMAYELPEEFVLHY